MGTNYYLNGKHIGKKSCGWSFLWAGTKTRPTPWKIKQWIEKSKSEIIDENDQIISKKEFFEKVAVRDDGIGMSLIVDFCEGFC